VKKPITTCNNILPFTPTGAFAWANFSAGRCGGFFLSEAHMELQIDKLSEAYHRIHKMNERDHKNGMGAPIDIGKRELFLVALSALDAGIKIMQDGRPEQAEEVLYEAAVYFIQFGEALEK
jgi:hypothetical protein